MVTKNLIFQVLIYRDRLSPNKRAFYEKCHKTVARYAQNIGSDYVLNRSQYFKSFEPFYEIFRIFTEPKYEQYDNVLYVDVDVLARNTNLNIFDLYDTFTACDHRTKNKDRPEFVFAPDFLNSGIVLFDRKSREVMKPHYQKQMTRTAHIIPGRDQLALNTLAYKYLGGYTKFKREHACYLQDKEAKQAILVHVAGRARKTYTDNESFWNKHFEIA